MSSPEGLRDIEGRKKRRKKPGKKKPDTFKGHFNLPSFNPGRNSDATWRRRARTEGRALTDRQAERERDSTLQGRAAALLALHESCI